MTTAKPHYQQQDLFVGGDTVRDCLRRLADYQGELLGHAELAHILNFTKGQLSMRRSRGGNLPPVYRELKMSPIWKKTAVRDWLLTFGK